MKKILEGVTCLITLFVIGLIIVAAVKFLFEEGINSVGSIGCIIIILLFVYVGLTTLFPSLDGSTTSSTKTSSAPSPKSAPLFNSVTSSVSTSSSSTGTSSRKTSANTKPISVTSLKLPFLFSRHSKVTWIITLFFISGVYAFYDTQRTIELIICCIVLAYVAYDLWRELQPDSVLQQVCYIQAEFYDSRNGETFTKEWVVTQRKKKDTYYFGFQDSSFNLPWLVKNDIAFYNRWNQKLPVIDYNIAWKVTEQNARSEWGNTTIIVAPAQ